MLVIPPAMRLAGWAIATEAVICAVAAIPSCALAPQLNSLTSTNRYRISSSSEDEVWRVHEQIHACSSSSFVSCCSQKDAYIAAARRFGRGTPPAHQKASVRNINVT